MKGRRFAGWHNKEACAFPPRECNVFYCALKDTWNDLKRCRAFCNPTPVVFLYLKSKEQTGTVSERDLIEKIVEVEFDVTMLGTFLCCAQYGPSEHWAYSRMRAGCGDGGAP